ncbi:MAG TPA: VWA domain-containing protein [Blastocatellia bacterium]|nr:VWA domain-containing protein [Blastocatellia bacterium]
MKKCLLVFSLIIAALNPSLPGLAQHGEQVIKLQTDLVTIDATVTDKDGNFIRKLKPEDFTLYEDGEIRKLDFFEASEEAALTRPLAVVFLLDISGSIEPEQLIKQREAAQSFIRLVQPESAFAVVTFATEFRLLQDFTSDRTKIDRAFQRIKDVGGSTRLFGSIDRSISLLKRAPRFRGSRRLRRVIVAITDGIDSVDSTDQPELIRRANEAEVTVYSITLPWYSSALGGDRIMTLLDVSRIVPLTGGKDFSADATDFTPVFKAVAEEIRSGYTLAFYPPDKNKHDGRLHQLKVECRKPGGIVRVSRTSYQAGKSNS